MAKQMMYRVPLRIVTPDFKIMQEMTVNVEADTIQAAYQLAVKKVVQNNRNY